MFILGLVALVLIAVSAFLFINHSLTAKVRLTVKEWVIAALLLAVPTFLALWVMGLVDPW